MYRLTVAPLGTHGTHAADKVLGSSVVAVTVVEGIIYEGELTQGISAISSPSLRTAYSSRMDWICRRHAAGRQPVDDETDFRTTITRWRRTDYLMVWMFTLARCVHRV